MLFLYFISNESVNNSGVYEIPLRTISVETGIPLPTLKKLLAQPVIKNIDYDMENEMVFVRNARKYSAGGNPAQVAKGILSEFQQNNKTFLWNSFLELNPQFKEKFSTVGQPLVNGSLPLPLPLPLKDLDLDLDLTNNKPLKMEVEKEVVDYLNLKAERKLKLTDTTRAHISARLKDGYCLEDFKYVIDIKCSQWKGDPKMDKFLRPQTLFIPDNFAAYRNEKKDLNGTGGPSPMQQAISGRGPFVDKVLKEAEFLNPSQVIAESESKEKEAVKRILEDCGYLN